MDKIELFDIRHFLVRIQPPPPNKNKGTEPRAVSFSIYLGLELAIHLILLSIGMKQE